MDLNNLQLYCLNKKGVTAEHPFGPDVMVFKVMNKMFALVDVPDAVSVNLKSDPEIAVSLRESHAGITPGYHMNKKHWITVELDGSIKDQLIRELIDASYDLVIKSLPKKLQNELNSQ